MNKVSIIIGSKSDSSTMEKTKEILDELEIPYEFNVISAHRDLEKLRDYVSNASKENIKVFITAAGGAAALPGVVAAMTNLPVIGVPIGSSSLKGIDALMSIVQMPPGIPVGCVALDSWGARNSAIYAASILALSDSKINENITKYKNKLKQK
jgi:5-(carboxyamino)imidazole ribonucleotide mutase|tara:strand:+ start:5929 stop:6387 length:459 start_codon:yes stop_codon:yes gene_type:complete